MTAAGIRLKQDGIVEALFEIRFETPVVPEAVIGRLTDAQAWAEYAPTRLSTADIPQQVRAAEPSLRFAPSYELARHGELIRVGSNILSYHRIAAYPGWAGHQPALKLLVDTLFASLSQITPIRLGLRYINALNGAEHLVASPADLALTLQVGETDPFSPAAFALNYRRQSSLSHIEQVQVATPDYVQSNGTNRVFAVIVDIDVFTPEGYMIGGSESVLSWIETAHSLAQANFFKLIPENTASKLKVG